MDHSLNSLNNFDFLARSFARMGNGANLLI